MSQARRAIKRQKFSSLPVVIRVGMLDANDGDQSEAESSSDTESRSDDGAVEAETAGDADVVATDQGEGSSSEVNYARTFTVHETLLKQSSRFFQAALKKEWKEAKTRTINLPDDEPDVADIYFDWLYSNEIATRTDELYDREQHTKEIDLLAKCYVFGEKLQDDKFCDTIIAALTELLDTPIGGTYYYFNASTYDIIFNGTSERSPARRLCVDIIVQCGRKAWLSSQAPTQHAIAKYPDLAVATVTALLKEANPRVKGFSLYGQRTRWSRQAQSGTGKGSKAQAS